MADEQVLLHLAEVEMPPVRFSAGSDALRRAATSAVTQRQAQVAANRELPASRDGDRSPVHVFWSGRTEDVWSV